MNNKNKIIIIIITIITIITLGGLTYAFFSANNVQGNSTTNTIVTLTADYGNITVTYDGTNGIINASNIDLKNSEQGTNKLYLMKFYINSTATINQDITIKWKSLTNTFCQYASGQSCTNTATDTFVGNELSYNLYACSQTNYTNATTTNVSSNCTSIGTSSVPTSNTKLTTTDYLTLSPTSTTYYVLLLTLQNKVTEQNYNQGKSFTGQVNIQRFPYTLEDYILKTHPPVSDAASSTYVTSASGIDFTANNSPTNGQGLYTNTKNSEGGTIKYFRGGTYCWLNSSQIDSSSKCTTAGGTWDSTTYHCSLSDSQSACTTAGGTFYELKNNVMFAGKAWKIVRINADGSIRLIYNGTSPTARGANAQTGTSAFKSSPYNDNTYIGYMYGAEGQSTYAATHTNATNSTIKGVLDTWYSNNLSSSASKIADAGFCGDRSMRSGDLGYGTNATFYGAFVRLNINKTPTFNCPNTDLDLYTLTTNSIGNKKLTYPIGLITADEVAYAGGLENVPNYTYYMQSGSYYWTMSPYYFSGSSAYEFLVHPFGDLFNDYVSTPAARPAVSLKSETTITGGTGTLTDPWIIAS